MTSTPSHERGHHRLRKGRFSCPGQQYLVTFCTQSRKPIFCDHPVAADAVAALLNPRLWQTAALSAWVLMPDHWHGLIQLRSDSPIASVVGRIKGASAYALGKRHPHIRPLWQSAFHDHALRAEEDCLAVAAYIVYNPVRAGLVSSLADYPYWGCAFHEDFNIFASPP
jgi:putative transposase